MGRNKSFVPKITKEEFDILKPLCGCPDKELIPWKEYYRIYGIPKYINGHNRKGKRVIFTEIHIINLSKSHRGLISKIKDIPKTKEHIKKIVSSRKNGVGYIAWNKGVPHTLETISKISNTKKLQYSDPRNHPGWKGGISFEPYCEKFNEAKKEEIRNNYDRKCLVCAKTEIENGRKLSVHHIDYDKEQGCNGKKWFLVPLCITHNSKANFYRQSWIKYINWLNNLWNIKEMMQKW